VQTFIFVAGEAYEVVAACLKVCIHEATGCATSCTTGWTKCFEYSFDQMRHIVYCPHSRLAARQPNNAITAAWLDRSSAAWLGSFA